MSLIRIHHKTVYRYNKPVSFGEHRLMFRPRDSHDLRHVNSTMTISPKPAIRWKHDVFGNSIAVATFTDAASELVFESNVTVEQYASTVDMPIAPRGQKLPVAYTTDELDDLGRSRIRHYPDPDGTLERWTRGFLDRDGTGDTLNILTAMTREISSTFGYEPRMDEGTRPPVETLALGVGACRDFALLMMEAVRTLGIAARFVSGYLYDPAADNGGDALRGADATHAWLQVYIPGCGWIEFDPTNGIVGGTNLIRVGVTRDPSQAVPVSGTYFGQPDDFIDLSVEVSVRAVDAREHITTS